MRLGLPVAEVAAEKMSLALVAVLLVPASLGVHDHWNNPTDRKYGRNLGLKEGIDLVTV